MIKDYLQMKVLLLFFLGILFQHAPTYTYIQYSIAKLCKERMYLNINYCKLKSLIHISHL